jgi:hypothetical protein
MMRASPWLGLDPAAALRLVAQRCALDVRVLDAGVMFEGFSRQRHLAGCWASPPRLAQEASPCMDASVGQAGGGYEFGASVWTAKVVRIEGSAAYDHALVAPTTLAGMASVGV